MSDYPEVRRVFTERGSHIEPPLDQEWSDLEKLRWYAAVITADTGVHVLVHPVNEGHRYSIQVANGSIGGVDFHRAWRYMNGVHAGAEAASGDLRERIDRWMARRADIFEVGGRNRYCLTDEDVARLADDLARTDHPDAAHSPQRCRDCGQSNDAEEATK